MKTNDYLNVWEQIKKEDVLENLFLKIFEKSNQDKVLNYISATNLKTANQFGLSENSSDMNTIKNELISYIDKAVNTQSPYFVNQLYGGAHPVAVITELVTAFMNTSMATYEIAPIATMYESEIMKTLAQFMGWETYDGVMVPGGSYANMMALHLSRFNKNPQTKLEGQLQKNMVYISDQAHYSVKKAAHLLGFGENQVRVIKTDSNYKMRIDDLEQQIQKDIKLNLTPTLVVSTLGTTVFGAIDSITEIQNIAKAYQLWHHVDGAWGAPLVFVSEEIRNALSLVDSVTYDFHKLLGGTLTKAIFITKNENLMSQANSCAGTQYIFHEDEDSFFDTGTKAIQCGRKVDSLSLWMTWKYLGHSGYRSYVEKLMALKEDAVALVNHYGYELLHQPEYLNICFKVPLSSKLKASHIDKKELSLLSNDFQKQLRRKLVQEGFVFVNYSSTPEQGVFIRLVLSHLRLNKEVLENIFKIIDETSNRIQDL